MAFTSVKKAKDVLTPNFPYCMDFAETAAIDITVLFCGFVHLHFIYGVF